MRKMNVAEFRKFCELFGEAEFICSTENQRVSAMETVRACLRFNQVKVSFPPQMVHFIGSAGDMWISDVTAVDVYKEKPCVGTVVKIHSGYGKYQRTTVWLMDKKIKDDN